MSQNADLVPTEIVERKIILMRGQKVLLAQDLARNRNRFPKDFMFQLTEEERDELASNCGQFNKKGVGSLFCLLKLKGKKDSRPLFSIPRPSQLTSKCLKIEHRKPKVSLGTAGTLRAK